ncbi:MAG: hypothetical protein A3K53_00530 [Deltaproteobacteria bacterium RIFOXYB2_FULL_66_7]|nr:MAG: hypothetical protein A3K53_00530 [Deltaproteobacteria bacterium RIFOXYB2_FULL_66_7]OGV81129.1 MAG: hypothetical protein A3K18_09375 [Lentisphaerae bacterium RIFOXYA12_64_32]
MECSHAPSFSAHPGCRLVNGTLRGAPVHQQEIWSVPAVVFGSHDIGGEERQLAQPFLHHLRPQRQVFGDMSLFVVFVAVGHDQVLAHTGNPAGRNTRGDEGITPIRHWRRFLRSEHEGGSAIQMEGQNVAIRIRQKLVGEQEHRPLARLGQRKSAAHELKTRVDGTGREDRTRELAMPRMQHKFQVRLLCPRRQSGRRSRALSHDDDDRRLGHGGQADAFRHQCETSPGSGRHAPTPGKRRPDGHIDSRTQRPASAAEESSRRTTPPARDTPS